MDRQRYSNLYTIFASVILNKPETNIALLAMVIMRIDVIQFMSIITIACCAMFVSGSLNKMKRRYIRKELPIHEF